MEGTISSNNIDFKQLVENSLNSIWLVGEDGRIIYCNRAGVKLLKCSSIKDVLYQNINLFLPPEFHEICNNGLIKVIKEKEILESMDIKVVKYNGDIADVEIMTFPFYMEDRVFAQVIIQDITERKFAVERLRDREKLASLGQLAAGIVHEVKNPLTAVKGFLQLIMETHSHSYLDTMESELDKAFDTLQNLLQVSKPDLQEEPIVLIDLCKELHSLLNLFQDRLYSVEVEVDLRDRDKRFAGKKNLLLKAFFNLLKNALEAIKNRGKIKIEHYFNCGMIHIKISDTGAGIPEDKLLLLGTPFYSSKPDGTGLGLTQVYTTIHEHGGNISVQSEMGKGTTFHIQLPLQQNNEITS